MIPVQELPKIVHGLLEKTKKGKVNWKGTASGGFRLQLPQSIIRMHKHRSLGEPDCIQLSVLGWPSGNVVGMWVVSQGEPHWELLARLFDTLDKQLSSDLILDDINRFIGQDVPSK